MTSAECEIVANAGVQLREIAERLTIPASATISWLAADNLLAKMDKAALAISEVYGALASLPLDNEGGGMDEARWYYICDACGSIVTIEAAPIPEDQAWECADCGSNAMWEFTSEEHAMQHSAHIQQLMRSGLLRRT